MASQSALPAVGSHRRLAVAAVVCLVVLAAAFIAGRVTAGSPEALPQAGPSDGSRGEPAGPGPGRMQDGVPAGFARSRDGAVAAAAGYVMLFDGPTLLSEQRRAAALDVVSAAGSRDTLATQLERGADLLSSRLNLDASQVSGDGGLFRSIPAGWRVIAYGDDSATVEVWGLGLLVVEGRGRLPAGWATTEVSLVWEDGDWRLAGFDTSTGPAPPQDGEVADPSLLAAMAGFEPFVHQPAPTSTRS